MRFKDVFSIIGPSMVGPSSSHTAGAVRLGRTARQLLGELPERADIVLYGSFADTYKGHGTDLALVAGLLDFDTDDPRVRRSLDISEEIGMEVSFSTAVKPGVHPNTASITAYRQGKSIKMTGCSIGGGNIEVIGIDDFDIKFTAAYPTLIIFHQDRSGIISDVTSKLKEAKANIGFMEVDRKSRSGAVLTVIECDGQLPQTIREDIASISNVQQVRLIDLTAKEGIE
ncbi:L-serine ammonia-lyase, iron-sulfur-dependent subunit beta [Paenibacillus sp. GXUN7292]|uniref:L-serine ammonia-lyase, iron-sulfur-dependent subunit beta n=1 Tax=Paenibacillus sp. GXUN7292 TaxID=3422499 RepID=UPI003D7F1833